MKSDDLKRKTLLGLMHLGAGKSAGKIISFASTLILARLLSPQDYGTMALVMVVIGFLGFFNEIGLGSAILQRPEISPSQLDGCFRLSLLISLALFGFVYFISPAIAVYYENHDLAQIIRFVALSFILGAASTVPEALLTRAMRFKLLASIEFTAVILQSGTTLVLAWHGLNVWSLAWGFFISQLFKASCIIYFSTWRPSQTGEMRAAFDLIKFGAAVTYSRITWYMYNNARTLIIGKTLNSQLLGIYSMADTLASLPNSHITSLVISVASPLFSKLQNDLKRLNKTLLRLTSGIALINYPVMVGMAITATEFIPVLLGNNWLEAILPLQILCLIGLIKSVDPLITQALISTGKVHITARYTSLCAVTIPLSVFFGSIQGGLPGAAIGMAVAYPLSSLYLFSAAKRHLQLSLGQYLRAIRLPLEACGWMAVFVLGIGRILMSAGLHQALALLTIKVITGIFAYAIFLIYIRKDGLRDFHEVLCELGISSKKLNRWPFTKLAALNDAS